MFGILKKIKYGMRVQLSKRHGEPEVIEVAGRPTMIMSSGDGPPFVYLHSSLGESHTWFPFYQSWAKHFTVYVPSHPGFHKSEGFDQIDSIEDMAFHYLELFDALGLDEVILGGVSLGGWIAAEFAIRWPERVKKLWLYGTPGFWVEDEPLPDLFRVMENREALRKLMFSDPEGYAAKMVIVDDPDEQRMLMGYQAMRVLAHMVWERPYSPKLAARLYRITCPTLLLWGEDDHLVPPAYGRAYAECLPNAVMKTIPKCGHLGMFEREKEFVKEILAHAQA